MSPYKLSSEIEKLAKQYGSKIDCKVLELDTSHLYHINFTFEQEEYNFTLHQRQLRKGAYLKEMFNRLTELFSKGYHAIPKPQTDELDEGKSPRPI